VKLETGKNCQNALRTHLSETGITNFRAVWVLEKPTTFTSFKFALRPAAITSFSVMCFWPLGKTIQRAVAPFIDFEILDSALKVSFESTAKKIHSDSVATFSLLTDLVSSLSSV